MTPPWLIALAAGFGVIAAILLVRGKHTPRVPTPPGEPPTSAPRPQEFDLRGLNDALDRGELELYYQPVFTAEGEVRDLEALLRWNHPSRGLIAAADFLPALVAAEKPERFRALTEWMLRSATTAAAQWRRAGHKVGLVVNLSAQSLFDDSLPELVTETAAAVRLPLSALSIEFREAAVAADPPRVEAALTRLSEAGITLGLDNVGAGTTHWLTVARAPVSRLTLDHELVRLVPDNMAAEKIVAGLVRIADDLALTSVAVGVESRDTAKRLLELGVSRLQGYALARPMSPSAVIPWLTTWHLARTNGLSSVTSPGDVPRLLE
jgi:diguanylate cyclase